MDKTSKSERLQSRREFLKSGTRGAITLGIGGIAGYLASGASGDDLVWQLDPQKCVQCGRCADECVLPMSAVRCVHAFDMCGYCDLCGGYLKPEAKELNTAAENQLCPTGAIQRKYVEDPYYEYHIEEELCIGCGKCVKGCTAFGNGSLHLQVRHNICVNCNLCSIAQSCPADAFERLPRKQSYLFKGERGRKPSKGNQG